VPARGCSWFCLVGRRGTVGPIGRRLAVKRRGVLQAPARAEADPVGGQLCSGAFMDSARVEAGGASEAEDPQDAEGASAVGAALAGR
jgi:hypothetical protein